MTSNNETTKIILDIANKEDYLRYIYRPFVSDMQAAFLVSGYVPISDFRPNSNSSRTERNIFELYLFLKVEAENNKRTLFTKKEDSFFAKLEIWTGFLFSVRHPVAESLIEAFLSDEKHASYEDIEFESINTLPQKVDIYTILKAKIEILDHVFPKFPYKYYMSFPGVKELVSALNVSEKKFCEFASSTLKNPRVQGRTKKNLISDYKEKHHDLHKWFEELEKNK